MKRRSSDSCQVYSNIPCVIRDRFEREGVLYVRNYSPGFDLRWQDVFQTDDPADVASRCRDAGIDFEWLGDNRLRTR